MKFSTYYKIQNRDRYFESYTKKYIHTVSEAYKDILLDKSYELMELIVKMIIEKDINNLEYLLSKTNAKTARIFFDHFSGLKTKHIKKSKIKSVLKEFFNKESIMKDLKSFLEEKMEPINLTSFKYKPFKLNEDDEMDDGGDDPFADDAGGGDDAGDDPFADDAGGGDAGGDTGDGGDADTGDTVEGSEDSDEDELDLEGHEDDPDFTKGKADSDSVMLSDTPAGTCIYDTKGVMQSIKAVEESLADYQLAEIKAVKKAVTLIFNGKILKPEDVTFQNPKNAAFLIKKIGANVDEITRNYLMLKIKQPLIMQRDKQKEDIAAMKNDTNNIRNTIDSLV